MRRQKLTSGNLELICDLIQSYLSQMLHEYDAARKEQIFEVARKFQGSLNGITELKRLGQILPNEEAKKLPEDNTACITVNNQNGFRKLALEAMTQSFGRFGGDAISTMAELLMYTNALGKAFQTTHLFYRGEQKYGYELKSRAERNLDENEGVDPGLTSKELTEIRRFQSEFKTSLPPEFDTVAELPHDDSPTWLPLMQHYDETFGTRLLSVASPICQSCATSRPMLSNFGKNFGISKSTQVWTEWKSMAR